MDFFRFLVIFCHLRQEIEFGIILYVGKLK